MSRLPFEWFLALRYLRPKRTFVSVITLISVVGVMLGVAVLIIVISVMSGFDQQLRDKILGFNAHLRVFRAEQQTLTNYAALMKAVASHPRVRGVAPFVQGRVMVQTEPEQGSALVDAPYIRGMDLRYETNVSFLHTHLVAGEYTLDGSSVLVGTEFARQLRLSVGDRIAVYSPRHIQELQKHEGKVQDIEEIAPPDDFTVRGIFDVGYYEFNASVIVTSLENAQDLYRLPGSVHGLLVMLDDPYRASAVAGELWQQLGWDYRVSIWTEENSAILNALMVEKNMMFYLLFFIMIVAAFGIMNSQITFVVQKTREIGALKALGATHGQVLWLFLSQSLVVGIVGVLTGLGLGMVALHYRNEFLHFMNRTTGIELFPASIYSFAELPALIMPADIALICSSALVICVLAGVIPAAKAARLRPVEALRHE
ncbi:MAG: ABC transporter permease [Verrucomicrobia bacterium]|nr:ABC transporter permease [Verrucomicrobiota bacterium]